MPDEGFCFENGTPDPSMVSHVRRLHGPSKAVAAAAAPPSTLTLRQIIIALRKTRKGSSVVGCAVQENYHGRREVAARLKVGGWREGEARRIIPNQNKGIKGIKYDVQYAIGLVTLPATYTRRHKARRKKKKKGGKDWHEVRGGSYIRLVFLIHNPFSAMGRMHFCRVRARNTHQRV